MRLISPPDHDRQLPELLETVARFLRSGSSLAVALRDASLELDESLRRELAVVLAGPAQGHTLAESFSRWAQQSGSPARQMVAAAMAVSHRVGGASAHTFDALASSLRARASVRREAHAMAVQARASAFVIGIAPLAFALVIAAADPSTIAAVARSAAGRLCLVAGLAFETLGIMWIRRLSRRAA